MRILVIGDFKIGKHIVNHQNNEHTTIMGISLVEYQSQNWKHENWEKVFLDDFHQLTIYIVDFDPDVIVYISPYLDYKKCQNLEERAFIANDELVLHLKESVSVSSPHIILLSVDLVFGDHKSEAHYPDDETKPITILGKSIKLGEQNLEGYRKKTILRTGVLVTKIKDQGNFDFKNFQYLSLNTLNKELSKIITAKQYGTFHLFEIIENIDEYKPVYSSESLQDRPYSTLGKI